MGSTQGDAIRNILAKTKYGIANGWQEYPDTEIGAFDMPIMGQYNTYPGATYQTLRGIVFDASRVVPTSSENRTVNTAYPPRIHV
jgi:hypothetical protein